MFETDLAYLQSQPKHIDKVKYLLNAMDVFSKRAYSEPLLNETGVAITAASGKILKQTPAVVRSDRVK